MWTPMGGGAGGVLSCSGTTAEGRPCSREGYTLDRDRGFRCWQHQTAPADLPKT